MPPTRPNEGSEVHPALSGGLGAIDTPPRLARRLAGALAGSPGDRGVLDPACGTGELLLAALERAGGSPRFAATRLHGIDRDPARVARARRRILHALGPRTDRSVREGLERHLRVGDALDPDVPWPAGTDVLANPPWVSLSGRHAVRLPPARLALYRRTWRALEGWPSLHGAFLERIAAHVRAHRTRARVLVPAVVCELDGYRATRAVVDEHCAHEAPAVELGERAFEGVVQPAVLVALAPRSSPPEVAGEPWATSSGPAELAELSGFPRLPPGSFADPGVHTGNAARELVHDAPGPSRAPVRAGRDLAPFALGEGTRFLRTDLVPGDGRHFRVPPLERLRAFPVLLRQTAPRPIAALHDPAGYFRNSLLACRRVDELDPAFVVAVLNGPVAALWHQARFRDARQRSFPQVKVKHLDTQPFPIARREDDRRLHDGVVERVRRLGAVSEDRRARLRLEIDERLADAFGLAADQGATSRAASFSSRPPIG